MTQLLLLIASLLGPAPSGPVRAADWPMLGRDATRNPASPEHNAPVDWDVGTGRNIRWKARLGSVAMADPVVAGGVIWIGSNNRRPWHRQMTNEAATLMAFQAQDGLQVLDYPMPPLQGPMHRVLTIGLNCSPLIEDNRLWFVTARAEVVAWDLGPMLRGEGPPAERWRRGLIDEFQVYPRMAIMADGKQCSIATSYRDRIYVVTANGAGRWGSPMPAPEAPSLICLQRDSGETLWTDTSPGTNVISGQWGSPLVVEINGRGQVITPQGDGWVRSFDALTGALVWKVDCNPKVTRSRADRNHFLNTPVLYENRVYLAGGQDMETGEGPGDLWCVDPTRSGDLSAELDAGPGVSRPNPDSGVAWHYPGLGRTRSNVAVAGGMLVAGGFDGRVHCLDATTGKAHWTFDTRARIFGSPLIVEGRVYVGNEDGVLHILALEPGLRLIARHEFAGPLYASPIFANGVLYVAASGDHLHAITNGPALPAHDWPQWRGPDRSNISREVGLLRAWSTNGPPLRWTLRGLGEGIAAVAVDRGRAYTLGYREESENLYAIDADTGEPVWTTSIGLRRDQPGVALEALMRWLSPRVPTVDGDRLYAISAAGVLTCVEAANGSTLWRRDYTTDFLSPPRVWGFCDYPLVDGENLIITPTGPGAAVVALNKYTGATVWRCTLPSPDTGSHSALVVLEFAGVRQYVTLLGRSLVGVAASDGRLLWRHMRPALRLASSYTPLVRGELIASPNGYGGGLNLIRLAREGSAFTVVELYQQTISFNPFQDSTALVGDRLHAVEGTGRLTCFDLPTGHRLYSADDLASNRRTAITYADGNIYLRRSDGKVCLVEITPDGYVPKGTFSIPSPEEVSGVTFPVVANGRLYLRDNDRLLCYDVRASSLPSAAPIARTLVVPSADARVADMRTPASQARSGVDRAPDAIFVPTPGDVVERMLDLVPLAPTNVVYDLGSGDGRILIAAARKYGCRGVGLEIDPRLVAMARENVRAEGLDHLVRIEHTDIFLADFSDADLVTAYLPSTLLERLLPQIRKLRPGARVVTHQFSFPGLRPTSTDRFVSKEDGDIHQIQMWMPPPNPHLP